MYPNLKLQLWKTGIRQNGLARMLGIDETLLSKVVNGFRDPSPRLREEIARLLGCNQEWLFEDVAPAGTVKNGSAPVRAAAETESGR